MRWSSTTVAVESSCSPAICQVSRVRTDGDSATRSGAWSFAASQRPISRASRRPRPVSARSRSTPPCSVFACRTRISRRCVMGGVCRGGCQAEAVDPVETARRCAESMYAADRASQRLGIAITDCSPGCATASMAVREDMANGHGICHGGYLFTLADTAFAFACNTYDDRTVAAGADISFLEPVTVGDRLVARATERARRGRSGLYDVTGTGADGSVVAEFRGRSRSLG